VFARDDGFPQVFDWRQTDGVSYEETLLPPCRGTTTNTALTQAFPEQL